MLLFILKLLLVLVFLVAFLRHPRPVWGIGLLTVTTAFLLDTFVDTFGWETIQDTLGYFFYVVAGGIIGGAAIWFWTMLRPLVNTAALPQGTPVPAPPLVSRPRSAEANAAVAFDRRDLYDTIRERLGSEDMRDLVFDLGINENDVFSPGYSATESIVRLMDVADAQGQAGDLALAVERILTPIATGDLPRVEKLSISSPPTVLRHYLLAHFNLDELNSLAADLKIDSEQLGGSKREIARNLLLHLRRRNRLDDLIAALHGEAAAESSD